MVYLSFFHTEYTMVYSGLNTPERDMALLSLCEHTVVSVGSFGWWSAWLANGVTVYYSSAIFCFFVVTILID